MSTGGRLEGAVVDRCLTLVIERASGTVEGAAVNGRGAARAVLQACAVCINTATIGTIFNGDSAVVIDRTVPAEFGGGTVDRSFSGDRQRALLISGRPSKYCRH